MSEQVGNPKDMFFRDSAHLFALEGYLNTPLIEYLYVLDIIMGKPLSQHFDMNILLEKKLSSKPFTQVSDHVMLIGVGMSL